ncbi:hypothetical protein [Halobacillus mangrovi]|uniref:hypothetical protein n=1 Tax=Halobacillus mangrovi TaxID=402384 RepID=UPI0026B09D5C
METLYDEEEGNLSSTVEAYTALLFSRRYKKSDTELIKARSFIIKRGGVQNTERFAKILMCLIGQYSWPKRDPIPIEVILLPPTFLVNLFDNSVFGRTNIIPILLLSHKKYQSLSAFTPDLSDIGAGRNRMMEGVPYYIENHSDEWRDYFYYLIDELKSKFHTMLHLDDEAIYLLSRQHYRFDDWLIHNPQTLPGGWGFSNINTIKHSHPYRLGS